MAALCGGHDDSRYALQVRANGHQPQAGLCDKCGDDAGLLFGFAFYLATLWRSVLSSDYVDGRFFRVTTCSCRYSKSPPSNTESTRYQRDSDTTYLSA